MRKEVTHVRQENLIAPMVDGRPAMDQAREFPSINAAKRESRSMQKSGSVIRRQEPRKLGRRYDGADVARMSPSGRIAQAKEERREKERKQERFVAKMRKRLQVATAAVVGASHDTD